MIKKLTIFFILLIPICIHSQQIIEKFRSEGKARDPVKQFIRNTDESENAINDINENGTDDFTILTRGESNLVITTYDGGNYDVIFEIEAPSLFEFYEDDELSRIPLIYPMGTSSDYYIITLENIIEGARTLIINPREPADYIFIPGRAILTADMDGDGWIDVLSIDFSDQSLVVHGIESGSGIGNENPTTSSRSRQEISLIYESEPGVTFNIEDIVSRRSESQDFNNDGAIDVTILRRNDEDILTGLRVVDVFSREVIFQTSLEGVNDEINRVHGYYDIDGDAVKEALIGSNLVLDQNGNINSIEENFHIQGVFDVNGDGVDDVIGLNSSGDRIQVWGLTNSTSTEEIGAYLGILANYPNPFIETINIEYELEKSGHVRVELRDGLGALIRSIHLGNRNAGVHKETLDFSEIAGGIYYCTINVNGNVSTQKMIKL